jgi:hypothetical protein
MGGAFWMEQAEHNIKCDPEAADVVFRSGIPMTICGLDVTQRVWLREADIARIREEGGDIGRVLADQVRRWWAFIGANENNPHDPLAILTAIRPELFRFEPCEVRVELDGEDTGRTRLDRCGTGAMRIAAEVDAEAARQEIVRRLIGDGECGRSGSNRRDAATLQRLRLPDVVKSQPALVSPLLSPDTPTPITQVFMVYFVNDRERGTARATVRLLPLLSRRRGTPSRTDRLEPFPFRGGIFRLDRMLASRERNFFRPCLIRL